MIDLRKIGWFNEATHVTTAGKVLKTGSAGVIVFDEEGKVPVLAIDEVSDDDTLNVFFKSAKDLFKAEDGNYEILIDRH